MAFQLRRGTNAQRLGITPLQGELIYTTDTKALYVGDGTTAGGTSISGGGGGGGVTYAVSAETAVGGANLRLTGSDASTDDVKLAAGSNVTITRTDANTITIAAAGGGGGGASALDDLTDVLIDGGTLTTGQLLKYNGTLWVNNDELAYSVSAETALNGSYIRLTGTDSSTDDLLIASGTNVTVTRTDASTITIDAATGILAVQDDTTPALGGNLDINGYQINGIGDIDITGTITSTDITTGIANVTSLMVDQNYANSQIQIVTEADGLSGTNPLIISEYNNNVNSNAVVFYRSRGTVVSPTPVQVGDLTVPLAYVSNSSDGSSALMGAFGIAVGSTVGAGVVSGRFILGLADGTGTVNYKLQVDENGILYHESTALTAGGGSGQVNTGSVSTYMKVNFNGVDYAIPLYALNP